MNIGIDTFGCDGGESGVGSYILSLSKNLPKQTSCHYEFFGHEVDRYTYNSGETESVYTSVQIAQTEFIEHLWHFFCSNRFCKKQNYDAILFPAGHHIIRYPKKIPSFVVIHDILSETLKHKKNRTVILYTLKKATKIIATSQYIKKNLISLKIPQEKIEVIHNGIDHSLFYPRPHNEEEIVSIQPFSIKKPYIIYASRISKPEKKHIELINAFNVFKKKTGSNHRLVLAGTEDDFAKNVHKMIEQSDFASDILVTGFFPHENFPELYSGAEASIFPSVTEGVGLPVLEAMASGIPVACSRGGSLTEMAGDCALYFNPDDPDDFAQAIEHIVFNEKLRNQLIKSGLEWTKRFSWKKTAEKTIALIENL